eukprot:TRINITY_DN3059_c0_g1_i1.p1 TRINITY_DN3059_c0_g1~~TRINITY_DN3059_c0_g1_i1.p1  ORF type:complete len:223 (-),score=35.41 TRINITY_DN3059_c0_g1_i1:65-733(-)
MIRKLFRRTRLQSWHVTLQRTYGRSTLMGFDSCPFPKIIVPNPLHWARNVFQARFLITPFFDSQYSNSEFSQGAESAMRHVSELLAEEELSGLDEDMISPDVLQGLKRDISRLSDSQKNLLRISEIGYSFIYRIGIIMPGNDGVERHVESTLVSFYHPSLSFLPTHSSFNDFKDTVESEGGLLVANYRFTRDFSKGNDMNKSNWIINGINHFHLNSLMYQQQ